MPPAEPPATDILVPEVMLGAEILLLETQVISAAIVRAVETIPAIVAARVRRSKESITASAQQTLSKFLRTPRTK